LMADRIKKVLECLGRNLPFWDKTIEIGRVDLR